MNGYSSITIRSAIRETVRNPCDGIGLYARMEERTIGI